MTSIQDLLTKGVTTIIQKESLEKKLASGKKLRVKFGIDPTGTIVHIGHMVPILKLRAFQDLGHQIVLIIWDATAQVGDTSDKDSERPMLERNQTLANASNWMNLFGKVLDMSKTEVRYNSEWMDTTNFNQVGELAKHFSVAEMLDRDNFSKRYNGGVRISLQEFLYPIMQGWDSVQVQADVELGGNDQYFNLLAGRTLQEAFGQVKQDIMTFELLLWPDGKKMSKTGGNCIAIDMEPNAMYVKLMEVADTLILDYFKVATLLDMTTIEVYQKRLESGEHPKNIKHELSTEIVSLYHGKEIAHTAREYFESVIAQGAMPSIESMAVHYSAETSIKLLQLVKNIGYFSTTGDARNGISWGGIRINGESMTDEGYMVQLSSEATIVQSGKKKFTAVYFGKQ
jgi:tyrosyl-tRNA synthetase